MCCRRTVLSFYEPANTTTLRIPINHHAPTLTPRCATTRDDEVAWRAHSQRSVVPVNVPRFSEGGDPWDNLDIR
jgi:hypothetical protein